MEFDPLLQQEGKVEEGKGDKPGEKVEKGGTSLHVAEGVENPKEKKERELKNGDKVNPAPWCTIASKVETGGAEARNALSTLLVAGSWGPGVFARACGGTANTSSRARHTVTLPTHKESAPSPHRGTGSDRVAIACWEPPPT